MELQAKVIEKNSQLDKNQRESSFIYKMTEHRELIAALLSGVLIVAAWVFSKYGMESTSVTIFVLAFLIGGYAKAKEGITETLKEKDLNVEMLMVFAAIGSAIIGYWAEGAILIFIFALSGALETYTMNKSKKEISSLMTLQPEEALRIIDGREEKVHVSMLEIADQILVKPGERVPADGIIIRGETTLDEAAITGESMPVSKRNKDDVFAGTVNLNGSIIVEITKKSSESLFQKIINLVQNAQSEKAPSQLFIEKFEGTYVKVVLAVVILMMFLPHYLLGWNWQETFYRTMILLVVASPCALMAAIMPATLSAISNGAKHGILFKGGVHLEKLTALRAIAFDKTGTLTRGKPEVTDVIVRPDITEKEFLLITASIESHSNHPLAQAIVQYTKERYSITLEKPSQFKDVPGWGIEASLLDKQWKIGKKDFIGLDEIKRFQNNIAKTLAEEGKTIVYVKDEEGIAGILALKDVVRDISKQAIHTLNSIGIHTIMLTGDSETTAQSIAKESGVNHFIAECLPETKVEHLKQLQEKYQNVGMVGDGINDAPALATASVGIAMGEGSDVALETADIVLMKNDLTKIADAITLSNRMNKIIKQNVVFSISIIMLLIASNFFQVLDLPYGVIGHEGSTLLVILNGLRLLR
ncbi:copper/silver-translocating P-type ATPase,heavy metal-translocating P-type ATPase, Cd/Co/Hg/Pb/Zn-transporting [Schinkia azotoformans MEV2011]|uniref:Copper/silver-translocating P-type ATPase,heavy metal-translocating P-type ATPase, Cd/Co/Hg/Pb/Zn-transporting n=1 Tax=Schinkia azotoformans MEV2011 TaxID=1348973 RepID=A0A072NEX2_SCHAZ|nr:heavy metal translocating P-type ATPase [Schinkia azotoformans]KEF36086.1 copper/silver-translocating P-type ATPase,heavy metal-translocating P-type ATPase, Cd/Co/Hg/Pb/Zn-transporting [Schinkia azotoformans MEV2011]MEC1695925.1 heavy metal translocating P-type ATPase [Schinkia azotoformans]MEC1727003.1 heavy metal translocating P-type ATPase [Schinkia azotoformans]MEC1773334.1 heavy metal translocating P-type ATPase [Schinkia azotoformans]MEC1779954.1 heavy metal translocating P-type ATPas